MPNKFWRAHKKTVKAKGDSPKTLWHFGFGRLKSNKKWCDWKCSPSSCLLLSCDIISHVGHQSCSELMTHPAHESFSSFPPASPQHAGAVPAQQLPEWGSAGARADLPALVLWSQLVEQIAVRLGLNLAELEPGCFTTWSTRGPSPRGPHVLFLTPWSLPTCLLSKFAGKYIPPLNGLKSCLLVSHVDALTSLWKD